MAVKIIWINTAKASLKMIYDYYKENTGVFMAQKIK